MSMSLGMVQMSLCEYEFGMVQMSLCEYEFKAGVDKSM